MRRPVRNTYWVVPGKLLAGEYPFSRDEQAGRQKLAALLDAGVTAFVDLTQDGEMPAYDCFFADYGKEHVLHDRFAIGDFSVPATTSQMRTILDHIDALLAEKHLVYVHCQGGIGRTGTVIGCWLARHGIGGHGALEKLAELWQSCEKSAFRSSPETPEQENYVVNWRK